MRPDTADLERWDLVSRLTQSSAAARAALPKRRRRVAVGLLLVRVGMRLATPLSTDDVRSPQFRHSDGSRVTHG